MIHVLLVTPDELAFSGEFIIEVLLTPSEYIPSLGFSGCSASHILRICGICISFTIYSQIIIECILKRSRAIHSPQPARRVRNISVSPTSVVNICHSFGMDGRQAIPRPLFLMIKCPYNCYNYENVYLTLLSW